MAEQATRKRRIYEGMGERIRERRGELALSQRALSEAADVAVDVIVKLEQDARGARPLTLQKLAGALGVSAEYLTTGRERERERVREAVPVIGAPPSDGGGAVAAPTPPYGGREDGRERPLVEVRVTGVQDEASARRLERMFERWMDEDAGGPDGWPETERDLDEDRPSYRKLFE